MSYESWGWKARALAQRRRGDEWKALAEKAERELAISRTFWQKAAREWEARGFEGIANAIRGELRVLAEMRAAK